MEADIISIAHGTNCWTRTPQSADLFAASLCAFLDIVRAGHPEAPIIAISPIVRPDAEETPNALGASLGDLPAAFEETIETRRKAGDKNLFLIPGRELVGKEQLPDGIHPGDAGHIAMAEVLGPVLAERAGQGDDHA